MKQNLFVTIPASPKRIIYTPSSFARSSLIYLQEVGTLKATYPHKNQRESLESCLFFIVIDGRGQLNYDGQMYELKTGDCVFLDCKKAYSHETGRKLKNTDGKEVLDLWSLSWCHFYGFNMGAIYQKYQERGGKPVFQTERTSDYHSKLLELYELASSDDYVRDMRLHEKLSSLLTLLMEDAWLERRQSEFVTRGTSVLDIEQVKAYLEKNYMQKITLDNLSSAFYINKYYLMSLFKERYGITINAYLNQLRVTYVKQQLRFSNKTLDMISTELGLNLAYLSKLFKKMEEVSPSEYRRTWRGK